MAACASGVKMASARINAAEPPFEPKVMLDFIVVILATHVGIGARPGVRWLGSLLAQSKRAAL